MPEVTVSNPYDGVDWDEVEHHQAEWHHHGDYGVDGGHEVVDMYTDLGYTILCVAQHARQHVPWPWEEWDQYVRFADDDGPAGWEVRDPEEEGVIAFPGAEYHYAEHIMSIFSTGNHLDQENGRDALDTIAEITDPELTDGEHVPPELGGLAVPTHVHDYYDDAAAEWERFAVWFDEFSLEDGLLGFDVYSSRPFRFDGPEPDRIPDYAVDLWDELLVRLMPERPIWGTGVDDGHGSLGPGVSAGRSTTEVLLHEDEFDPSDQSGSREHVASALREGRFFAQGRTDWTAAGRDVDDPWEHPRVERIAVADDAAAIGIEASSYDEIAWISGGEVVETGQVLEVDESHEPYVRAVLSNENAETATQPFGVAAEDEGNNPHHPAGFEFVLEPDRSYGS